MEVSWNVSVADVFSLPPSTNASYPSPREIFAMGACKPLCMALFEPQGPELGYARSYLLNPGNSGFDPGRICEGDDVTAKTNKLGTYHQHSHVKKQGAGWDACCG